jgi:hypothetical protein
MVFRVSDTDSNLPSSLFAFVALFLPYVSLVPFCNLYTSLAFVLAQSFFALARGKTIGSLIMSFYQGELHSAAA